MAKRKRRIVGGLDPLQGVIMAQQQSGTNFNNYTTAKTVLNSQCVFNLPPSFWYVGKTLRITVAGSLSNIVTTPGLVFFQVMVGAVIAFTTGQVQLNATAHTLLPFWLDILLTLQTVGAGTAAKFMGMARLQGIQFTLTAAQIDSVNTGGVFSAPATAPAQGTGWDSTIVNALDFFVGWTINNGGNAIIVNEYIVEALN